MATTDMLEPFPGNYVFEGNMKPTELDIAARVRIPSRTMEPWQVHYAPFKELIIIEQGELYVQMQLAVDPYSKGDRIRIREHAPHRLVNNGHEDAVIIVESSPGPEYRLDLEPEFPDLNACLRALNERLMSDAIRA